MLSPISKLSEIQQFEKHDFDMWDVKVAVGRSVDVCFVMWGGGRAGCFGAIGAVSCKMTYEKTKGADLGFLIFLCFREPPLELAFLYYSRFTTFCPQLTVGKISS